MWRTVLFHWLIVLWLQGCSQVAPPYDPFKIPKSEFFAKTKVVALAPLALAVSPDNPDATREHFESLLDQKLRAIGFTVIPSREYRATWERLSKQIGGIFDPITGKRDEQKIKAVRGYLLEELRTKHQADALLHPIVQVVEAKFQAGHARWHGATEPVIPEGFWNAFLMGDSQGTTSALSLYVTIEDTNGTDIFIQAGGIQLLAKVTSVRRFTPIPQSQLLANADRNKAAVELALSALSPAEPSQASKQGRP